MVTQPMYKTSEFLEEQNNLLLLQIQSLPIHVQFSEQGFDTLEQAL